MNLKDSLTLIIFLILVAAAVLQAARLYKSCRKIDPYKDMEIETEDICGESNATLDIVRVCTKKITKLPETSHLQFRPRKT